MAFPVSVLCGYLWDIFNSYSLWTVSEQWCYIQAFLLQWPTTHRVIGFEWHQSEGHFNVCVRRYNRYFVRFVFDIFQLHQSWIIIIIIRSSPWGHVAQSEVKQLVCCLYVWVLWRRQTWKLAWVFAQKQRANHSETHRVKHARRSDTAITSPRFQSPEHMMPHIDRQHLLMQSALNFYNPSH